MVGALEATGAIGDVADAVKDVTGGDRTAELLGIVWIAAIGSAVVDNIPFTTAMIPVVKELQESAARRRRRLLVGAVARRLLRRQRDDDRRGRQRRRRGPGRAGRDADRLHDLPPHRDAGDA